MPAEPAVAGAPEGAPAGPRPVAAQSFVMMGDDGALCVDGVCAVPTAPLGSAVPSGPAPSGT